MRKRGAIAREGRSALWYAYQARNRRHFVSLDAERYVEVKRLPNSDGSDDEAVRGEFDHGDKPTYSLEYLKAQKARVYPPGAWL